MLTLYRYTEIKTSSFRKIYKKLKSMYQFGNLFTKLTYAFLFLDAKSVKTSVLMSTSVECMISSKLRSLIVFLFFHILSFVWVVVNSESNII